MTKFMLALMLALGFSSAAQAGLLIEPYLGYHIGALARDPIGGTPESTDTMTGTALGLRLGYKFVGPWVALDATQGSGKWKDGTPGSSLETDYTTNQLGLVAGVDIPFLFRVWGGYGLQNNTKLKAITSQSGATDTMYYGSYLKGGIGLSMIPFISLNVEYIMNSYQKLDNSTGNGKVDVDSVYSNFKDNVILVGISVPFNL